jgi:hypothetical protein
MRCVLRRGATTHKAEKKPRLAFQVVETVSLSLKPDSLSAGLRSPARQYSLISFASSPAARRTAASCPPRRAAAPDSSAGIVEKLGAGATSCECGQARSASPPARSRCRCLRADQPGADAAGSTPGAVEEQGVELRFTPPVRRCNGYRCECVGCAHGRVPHRVRAITCCRTNTCHPECAIHPCPWSTRTGRGHRTAFRLPTWG